MIAVFFIFIVHTYRHIININKRLSVSFKHTKCRCVSFLLLLNSDICPSTKATEVADCNRKMNFIEKDEYYAKELAVTVSKTYNVRVNYPSQ